MITSHDLDLIGREVAEALTRPRTATRDDDRGEPTAATDEQGAAPHD